uniref:Uncharacterized protein LOC105032728 n=1 Tax=Elaeis guineensis var. tenera TaxID=51953 RepID=A0A6I9QAA2_ELAGV|nr:uncharacterized protein LOC105032728 [Elaeis guineensis]
MEKSELISDSFSWTLALVNQMKANGEKISDQHIVEKDDRKSTSNNSYQKGRDSKSQGHQEKKSGKAKDKPRIQSFNCKKYGYRKSQCYSKKGEGRTLYAKVVRSADSDDELERALLFICDVVVEDRKNIWFLDIGCSNHMCGQKELFSKLDDTVRSEVKFENNMKIPIMKNGYITIKANDGSDRCITDVYYVLGLHQNLLSMGQLFEHGYNMQISDGLCTIRDRQQGLIAKVKKFSDQPFPLHIRYATSCFNSTIQDSSWLWHMHFGHMNFDSLKLLSRKQMVSGLPKISSLKDVGEMCVVEKKCREVFSSGQS